MNQLSRSPCASFCERKALWLVFAAVFAIALAFAAYAQHAWEDYYITYRVSKNLALGHGLVYTVGERVHAFTSPFNVLIPAALSLLTGNHSDELVLWLFRVVSAALLGGAAVLLFESARKNSLGRLATVLLIGLFALDAKIVDFSTNGQEVAFMMFFLALALHALTVSSQWTALELGLAGAGLMWTRPDGFVYLGAIALGFLLFDAGRPIGQSRLGLLKLFLSAGAITIVLYVPWILWAWSYFGTPVPHTIIAKGMWRATSALVAQGLGHSAPGSASHSSFLSALVGRLLRTSVDSTFLPAYALVFGGWHWTAVLYARCLAFVCVGYWCLPFARPQARAASFAFMLGHIYLSYVTPCYFPWYVPSCGIFGLFVLAHIAQQVLDFARSLQVKHHTSSRWLQAGVRILTAAVLTSACLILLSAAWQLRIQQREIEDGTRKQIGLWLRQQAASPADTVFLEPLGYIGFFSQLKMLDTPGLCAPEVVAAERRLKTTNFGLIIPALRPDWLVLRPKEADQVRTVAPHFLAEAYSEVKVFDATARVAAYRWLPGRGYLHVDQKFIIFKRNQTLQTQPDRQ